MATLLSTFNLYSRFYIFQKCVIFICIIITQKSYLNKLQSNCRYCGYLLQVQFKGPRCPLVPKKKLWTWTGFMLSWKWGELWQTQLLKKFHDTYWSFGMLRKVSNYIDVFNTFVCLGSSVVQLPLDKEHFTPFDRWHLVLQLLPTSILDVL